MKWPRRRKDAPDPREPQPVPVPWAADPVAWLIESVSTRLDRPPYTADDFEGNEVAVFGALSQVERVDLFAPARKVARREWDEREAREAAERERIAKERLAMGDIDNAAIQLGIALDELRDAMFRADAVKQGRAERDVVAWRAELALAEAACSL